MAKETKKKDSDLPDYALVERQEMLRGLGYGDEAIGRLQIGVVSSWGELNAAAIHLDHEVYLDSAKVRLFLVVEMEASQHATIMKEVIETGMVGETTCYFYGAFREAKGKVVNPVWPKLNG